MADQGGDRRTAYTNGAVRARAASGHSAQFKISSRMPSMVSETHTDIIAI